MPSKKTLFLLLAALALLAVLPIQAAAVVLPDPFCDIPGAGSLVRIPCPLGNVAGPAGQGTVGGLILSIIQILLLVVGSIAVLFMIIGGYRYITASGNEVASEAAKKTLTHAVLGLVIVIVSFAIIGLISNLLISGKII